MERHWIVYCYLFPNGKRYIGCTRQKLNERQRRTGDNMWNGYKNQGIIWDAIREFGEDNIVIEILYEGECCDEYASYLEQMYIEQYKTNANKYNNPSYGYNQNSGGGNIGDRVISEESHKKFSEHLVALNKQRAGRTVTERTRYYQRMAKLGVKRKPFTEETLKRMSEAQKKKSQSKEYREKQSKILSKQVLATNEQTGECLLFYSHQKVADYFGVSDSTVSRWILGQTPPKNGFIFEDYVPTTTDGIGSDCTEYVTV